MIKHVSTEVSEMYKAWGSMITSSHDVNHLYSAATLFRKFRVTVIFQKGKRQSFQTSSSHFKRARVISSFENNDSRHMTRYNTVS